jgi:methylmalonyl-CoA mutase
MAKAVAAGWPKAMIEEAAAAKQARVDRGEDVIVGVNKYRPAEAGEIEILEVDNHRVREAQVTRINRVKAGRDEAACQAALENLRAAARHPTPFVSSEVEKRAFTNSEPALLDLARSERGLETNLLALAVEAARARATLGEISAAMEDAFGRYDTVPAPVQGVYGAAHKGEARWAAVLDGIAAFERRRGRKPRLLVAKMGQDGHDRGANVVASAFGDMGFEVVSGPLFQTPEETLVLALEKDVDVVGASSLAAGHKTLIPELVRLLKDAGRPDIRVIAGGVIPSQDYDYLRERGVAGIYGPGSNIVECAADVLRLLGHNMPPIEEAAE